MKIEAGKCKKGDRVRRVEPTKYNPDLWGRVGDLGTVEKDFNGGETLYVQFDGQERAKGMIASAFELVDAGAAAEPKFKEGDRVRVASGRFGSQKGQVGTVFGFTGDDDLPVVVVFDDPQPNGATIVSERNYYDHADLEPWTGEANATAAPTAPQPGAIGPGSRVRCINGSGDRQEVKDKLGTVVRQTSDGTSNLLVKFDGLTTGHGEDDACWFVPLHTLELVTDAAVPPAREFKPGDEIISVSDEDPGIAIGDIFTVTSVLGDTVDFVDNDGCPRTRWAKEYRLAGQTIAEEKAPGLVIEAGKNYRLRNGVLVGPISANDDDQWVWKAPQDISDDCLSMWATDGRFDPDGNYSDHDKFDIVAEWIGDIPEFKEGDQVVNICDDDTDLTIGSEYVVITVDGGTIDFSDDVGDERTREACRYRLAGQPLDQTEPEKEPEFAAGDLIRSVSDTCDDIAPGDTFTVTGIEEDGPNWLVSFIHPKSGERSRYAARYERVAA